MRRQLTIFLFLFQIFLAHISAKGLPADISFFIADLKYSEKEGVKICEVQQGTLSVFSGYDYLNKTEKFVENRVADILTHYKDRIWYMKSQLPNTHLRVALRERGALIRRGFWSLAQITKDPAFISQASVPPANPSSILDYSALLIASPNVIGTVPEFRERYPGILVLDMASYPYWIDKYKMSLLFRDHQLLENIKPTWKLYQKEYFPQLAQQISQEIPGDIVVIKPRGAFKGEGVIITSKRDLDDVLALILTKSNELRSHEDLSFRRWAYDKQDSFIVEQFHESDPVSTPQFGDLQFDGTMRVVFVLTYHQAKIQLEMVECHWKLPKRALSEQGTLSEIHKSFGKNPHFAAVSPSVQAKVEEQLREALPIMYERMLNSPEL